MATRSKLQADHLILQIDGKPVEIVVRRNDRARRYSLRLPQNGTAPVLTIPKYGTMTEARQFIGRHENWLSERLSSRPEPSPIVPGAEIPLRGVPHRINVIDSPRGRVRLISDLAGATMCVPGGEHHFHRRLIDYLKNQARSDLVAACDLHAGRLGLSYRSISVRDQKTRWGSCSSDGRLNFSWRLILAPSEILDYVAAHEVAHLREMNHSANFWALVRQTCPDMDLHRAWLRENGAHLHLFE